MGGRGGGGSWKTNILGGGGLPKGGLGQLADLRGLGKKEAHYV